MKIKNTVNYFSSLRFNNFYLFLSPFTEETKGEKNNLPDVSYFIMFEHVDEVNKILHNNYQTLFNNREIVLYK